MALSPLAEIVGNSLHQTCTVYPYEGVDVSGQTEYGTGTSYPCRVAIRTKRTVSNDGDVIANTDVTFLLPADAAVQAYDRIDLPAGYQAGAVIREVVTATDWLGRVTHQVVRIL